MEVAIVLCLSVPGAALASTGLHCQEPFWHRLVFIARSHFGIDWFLVPGAALASTGLWCQEPLWHQLVFGADYEERID